MKSTPFLLFAAAVVTLAACRTSSDEEPGFAESAVGVQPRSATEPTAETATADATGDETLPIQWSRHRRDPIARPAPYEPGYRVATPAPATPPPEPVPPEPAPIVSPLIDAD